MNQPMKYAVYITVSSGADLQAYKSSGFLIAALEQGYWVSSAVAAGNTVHYILAGSKPLNPETLKMAGHNHGESNEEV